MRRFDPRSDSYDALRGYRHASQHGFVTLPGANGEPVSVAAQCPRRWLVVLNLQLDPRWLAAKRMKQGMGRLRVVDRPGSCATAAHRRK
ncbi:hypothetical protein [Burkholderia sp. PU8-34]